MRAYKPSKYPISISAELELAEEIAEDKYELDWEVIEAEEYIFDEEGQAAFERAYPWLYLSLEELLTNQIVYKG